MLEPASWIGSASVFVAIVSGLGLFVFLWLCTKFDFSGLPGPKTPEQYRAKAFSGLVLTLVIQTAATSALGGLGYLAPILSAILVVVFNLLVGSVVWSYVKSRTA